MLNKILRRAMGESYASKHIVDNSVNSYAESYSDSLYIKDKRISSENIELKSAINSMLDDTRGVVKARGELFDSPRKINKKLKLNDLLMKGYNIKGITQEEIREIIEKKGFKVGLASILQKYSDNIGTSSRIDMKVFLDENGFLKSEVINEPTKFVDKFRALINRNNELQTIHNDVIALLGIASNFIVPSPAAKIPSAKRHMLTVVGIGVMSLGLILPKFYNKLFPGITGFLFKNPFIKKNRLENLTEMYIDTIATISLIQDLDKTIMDLLNQSQERGDSKTNKRMVSVHKYLDKLITKEIKKAMKFKLKLQKKMGGQDGLKMNIMSDGKIQMAN